MKKSPKKFKKTVPQKITPTVKKSLTWGKDQFPTFSRIIPEGRIVLKNWKTKRFWIGFVSIVLMLIIIIEVGQVYKSYQEKRNVEVQRQKIISEIDFWKKITEEYKGYRDAYYRIAILEYQLGDKVSSRFYLQKALLVDPLFEDARKLEKLLR